MEPSQPLATRRAPELASTTGPEAHAAFTRLRTHLEQRILGQPDLIEKLLVCLLADGHLLVEGAPGLAKTTAIKTLAAALEGEYHRIQFTPDLLPADLTGTEIFQPGDGQLPLRARSALPQSGAGRRDQPRAGEGAVGAARSDGRAPDHRGASHLPVAGALPRDGDAEPDRAGRHLSAARSAARPLPAARAGRLPRRGVRAARAAASCATKRRASAPGALRAGLAGAASSRRASEVLTCTSRRSSRNTSCSSCSRRGRPSPYGANAATPGALRREPARHDRARSLLARARLARGPRLRHARRRPRRRARRAAPPHPAELRGRGRRRHAPTRVLEQLLAAVPLP